MRRAGLSITIAILALSLLATPMLAAYYAVLTVTESLGNSYTELAMNMTLDVQTLVDEGFIAADGTDTRVTDSDYNVLPHMLADDRLMWTGNVTANTSQQFIFWAGQTALTSFPVITGHDGYVTVNDTADLEPGNGYVFQIVGYVDMTATNGSIIYKPGACSLNRTSASNLTWNVVGGNSLVATGVTTGYHTIVVTNDGANMTMDIDTVQQDIDTASAVPDTANDWQLFHSNIMPYVYYYDQWVVLPWP
jgi:hypothetical protein